MENYTSALHSRAYYNNLKVNLASRTDLQLLSLDFTKSSHYSLLIRFVINYFTEFLAICGIVGNVLNIIILSHHGFKDTTNIMVAALAVDDLIFSLTESIIRVSIIMQTYNSANTLYKFCRNYIMTINGIFISFGIVQVAAIALERLVAVWFPFLVSRLFTPRRVTIGVCLVHAVTLVLHYPVFTTYTGQWDTFIFKNVTVDYFVMKGIPQHNFYYVKKYNTFMLNISFPVLTLIVSLVSSISIMVKMFLVNKQNENLSASRGKSFKMKALKATKKVLVVCVFALFVCTVTCVLELFKLFSRVNAHSLYLFFDISHVLFQLAAVSNFIIYVSMSSKFKKTYKKLFC